MGCLLRGLATGRARWYSGRPFFGLGFQLYYISRAWLLLLAGLLVYRLLTEPGLLAATGARRVSLGRRGAADAAAPVLVYAAAARPTTGAGRSVSLATPSNSGSLAPLAKRYSAPSMWNVTGDSNGRHNLPDARLLDPITAALLPCGLALALALAWRRGAAAGPRWPYLLPAVGLVALLAGGVLSFARREPPGAAHAGRSSMVALLAALPLAGLWRALADLGGRVWRARPATWPGPAAVGGYGGGHRVDRHRRGQLPALLPDAGAEPRRLQGVLNGRAPRGRADQRARPGDRRLYRGGPL